MREQIRAQKQYDHDAYHFCIERLATAELFALHRHHHCHQFARASRVCALAWPRPNQPAGPGFAFISCVYFKHYYYDYYLIRPTVVGWCGLQLTSSSNRFEKAPRWRSENGFSQDFPNNADCICRPRLNRVWWCQQSATSHLAALATKATSCRMPTLARGPQIHCD